MTSYQETTQFHLVWRTIRLRECQSFFNFPLRKNLKVKTIHKKTYWNLIMESHYGTFKKIYYLKKRLNYKNNYKTFKITNIIYF